MSAPNVTPPTEDASAFEDDDGRADERVSLAVSDDDRWSVVADENGSEW
jgi:hypothetical protein